MAVQWNIYMWCGRHICLGVYAKNVNAYMPVFLVILLFALSSFEAHILI